MNLALFSEISVRDYYDSAVTQPAERRVFAIPEAELHAVPRNRLVDRLLGSSDPGRLVLDPTVNEEVRAGAADRMHIRRWLEFSGPARLLSLRPRRYHATPPFVSMLQAPAAGEAGRILLEQNVKSIPEKRLFDEFCQTEFGKITEYARWINEDLDYYEHIARDWLLSMIDARILRHPDAGADRVKASPEAQSAAPWNEAHL